MANNIFLYHKNCDDGFGAAWAAWKKFGKNGKYIGIVHDDPIPKGLKNKNIYFLDICYKPEVIKKLLKIAKSITVIDHHISAEPAIKLIPNRLYELNHSGAALSWKYFHPNKKLPTLLECIEDQDLWHWTHPHSQELMSALKLYDFDFKVWSRIASDCETKNGLKKYLTEGKILLTQRKIGVKNAVKDATKVIFCGYKTLAVNTRSAVSDIGAALSKKLPPIAIVWSERNGKIVVSLRSNGKVDVSKLAARFGGGGHKASSAFRLDAGKPFPWKRIK